LEITEEELKDGEELAVPMPAENATLNGLAVQVSRTLPTEQLVPSEPAAARERLREIIRLDRYECRPHAVKEDTLEETNVLFIKAQMDDAWSAPAVEFKRADRADRTILIGDEGRKEMHAEVRRRLDAGERVLAIDLCGFGEAGEGVAPIELQMVATVGRRLLGIQAPGVGRMV
jgi:hypothetical protein